MSKIDLKKIKEENGAVEVVEMTFVFPLVLAMVFVLFFLANSLLQGSFMYYDAQKIAVLAARTVEMPGYHEIYHDTSRIETTADFSFGTGTEIELPLVEAIMKHHDPYRYFATAFKSTIGAGEADLEKAAENMMKKLAFVGAEDYRCDIGVTGGVLSRTVRVTVEEDVKLPAIVRFIGQKPYYTMTVTAYAGISDSSEFVRNTELVYDLGKYLYENVKLGPTGKTMSEMVADFKEKIKGLKGKFGLSFGD